jgi:3-oxoacyl-[acyl-carrier protein] reductase
MNLDLSTKSALVCGSTQGIGKAIALELAQMGAKVILVARNEESLRSVKAELSTSKGQQHDFIVADFTSPEELQDKINRYVIRNGAVNILINNTGGPPGGPIVLAKTEEFKLAFSNHLLCNHLLVQTLVDGMRRSGYGRIINIISTSVKQPLLGLGVSNTIRAAVANWSKTLSIELGPFGITVNNVLPGATNTSRITSILENKASKSGKSTDEVKKEMLAEIPAGRFAEASEIANAVAFLASPAAAYITGVNIPVDGGRTGCL